MIDTDAAVDLLANAIYAHQARKDRCHCENHIAGLVIDLIRASKPLRDAIGVELHED